MPRSNNEPIPRDKPRHGTLVVGRASAGSGKTFTLTLEYIRLLTDNPDNYRHILAVTFTNKATGELKSRIIDTLHAIATGSPKAQPYIDKLQEHTPADLRNLCATALNNILHDYSHFRVETIDSFFQSIVRDLARELNLTANLRVDLDQQEVLEDAVRTMIEGMHRGDATFNAVINYVSEKMNSDKPGNWKIDKELTEFGQNIFNEHYLKAEKAIRQRTDNAQFYPKYKDSLRQDKQQTIQARIDNAKRVMQHIDTFALEPSQFIGGSRGVYAYFPKVAEGKTPTIPKALRDDPHTAWLKDPDLNARHIQMFQDAMEHELRLRRTLATTDAILRHANKMQLLGKVDETVRRQNEEHNRFVLADTAHRLHDIMSDSDVPFIMEKAAMQFRYIMIDEFQDTSELQWVNFQPLIKECIAAGCRCIIVGDVKQSIYRWRNSDWSILNDIDKSTDFAAFVDETDMRKALDTNRRSDENIVAFNNTFFRCASRNITAHLDEMLGQTAGHTADIITAYADVEQKIVDSRRGHGHVSVMDLTTQSDADTGQGTDPMLTEIEATIRHLVNDTGLTYSDIAILTRANNELKTITQHLKQSIPDIQIVSSEAFQLDSSPAIRMMILALRALSSTDKGQSMFYLGTLAYRYQTLVCNNHATVLSQYYRDAEQMYQLLPKAFVEATDELQIMPLQELCERIYDIFSLSNIAGQSAYLFMFFDELSVYTSDTTADIDSFLQYWDEKMYKKNIPAEGAEGVQMLTIHRSKGLEFHTVIVPYCNWEMGGKPSILWCDNDDNTDGLPIIPVTFGKTLDETDFKQDYETEVLKNYVDNLNLLYVAFTRASHNLIVMTSQPKGKGYSTYDVVTEVVQRTDESADKDSRTLMSIGQEEPHYTDTPPAGDSISVDFNTGKLNARFRQSNASKDFVHDPDAPESERQTYIKRGLIVHKVFEKIHTETDIPQIMRELEQQGVMGDTAFKAEIEEDIRRAMANEQVRQWFSPKWKVMNESSIIVKDEEGNITTQRPDRVIYDGQEAIVIDYKTGKEHASHAKQVRGYICLLHKMGYRNVKGYLWYIGENNIISVEPNHQD